MFVGYPFLLGVQKEARDKGASNSLNAPTSGSQWFAIGCYLSADFIGSHTATNSGLVSSHIKKRRLREPSINC